MARNNLPEHDHSGTGNGGSEMSPKQIDLSDGSMAVPVVDETSEVDDPGPGQIVRITGDGSDPEGIHQWDGSVWVNGASVVREAILPGLNSDFSGSVTYSGSNDTTLTITIPPAIFDRYVFELADPSGDTAEEVAERRFYYQGDLIFTDSTTIDFTSVDSYDSGDLSEIVAADTIEIDHNVPSGNTIAGTYDFTPDTQPLFPHFH